VQGGDGGVDEYLDKNRGAKSYLDSSPYLSGPNSPQSADATMNSTNRMSAPNTALAIDSPLSNNNSIIPNSPSGNQGFFVRTMDTVGGFFDNPAGKQGLRSMPFIGTAAGLFFAGQEVMTGNFSRAGLEIVSAIGSAVPGIGTPIGLSADAALMAGVGLPQSSNVSLSAATAIQSPTQTTNSFNMSEFTAAMHSPFNQSSESVQARKDQIASTSEQIEKLEEMNKLIEKLIKKEK